MTDHPILLAFLVIVGLVELFETIVHLSDCGEFAIVALIGAILTFIAVGLLLADEDTLGDIESGIALVFPFAAIYFWHVPFGCAII
ncbi:MAG: hypothetical protein WBW47_06380 [Thermoplasmata archaeon]